jgi:alkylation response protein AidB-like acyl-CoA dehydrogenase
MRFMETDVAECDKLLPGLRHRLADHPLMALESEDSPAIELFRTHDGPGLLVPAQYGGLNAGPLQAVRVMRALAAVAPSLTVATMMHHFSVGTLFAVAEAVGADSGLDDLLLKRIARERLLVASGFAEGRSGQGILTPGIAAVPAPGGYLISGSKKPCSLSGSMDVLTASVAVTLADGSVGMGLVILPADTPGLSVHPFWNSFALAGAQSHEVRLTDVQVAQEQIILPDPALAEQLDQLQTVGLIWFQLSVCAAYTGIASALVERVLRAGRGSASDRAALAVRIESAAALAEGLARRIEDGDVDNDGLAAALVTRFAVQDAVRAAADQAVELLGGMAYVSSSEVAYLSAACHAIAFHPPSRASAAEPLLAYYGGEPLVIA